jgi:hypothetical protein
MEELPAQSVVDFRPRAWRCWARRITMMVGWLCIVGVILIVVFTVGWLPTGNEDLGWPGYALLSAMWLVPTAGLLADVRRFAKTYTVRVSAIDISVPQRAWSGTEGLRETLPLGELDRVRSAKRGPIDRFMGVQWLYSTTGKKLRVWRWAFSGSDMRAMLGMLGIEYGQRPRNWRIRV